LVMIVAAARSGEEKGCGYDHDQTSA